jgi:hypothetical protein
MKRHVSIASLARSALLASAALFLATRADAQTVTVTSPIVNREPPDAGPKLVRADGAQYFISYADCVAIPGVTITFDVTVSGDPSGGAGFQLWGTANGTDCTQAVNRSPTQPLPGTGCVLLEQVLPPDGMVSIDAQDLVTKVLGLAGCDATPPGGTDPVQLDLYFLLDDTGTDPVPSDAYYQWTGTEVDLLGPAAPTVSVSGGEQSLIVDLPTDTDPDLLGYILFCNALGTGTVADAGSDADGGSNCAGEVGIPFLDPQRPDPTDPTVQQFICGNSPISPSSSSATVTGVTVGQPYVVVVAGYDVVDNVGPLSVPQCGTPLAPMCTPLDPRCSPYACVNGVCETSCQTIFDCATGYACDPSGACIPSMPGQAYRDEAGCALSSSDGPSPAWIGLGLLAALCAARRARRAGGAPRP